LENGDLQLKLRTVKTFSDDAREKQRATEACWGRATPNDDDGGTQ